MSEWIQCNKCGLTHENMCACPEPHTKQPPEEEMNTNIRRFVHKSGRFGDSTEYLEYRPDSDSVWIKCKDYPPRQAHYYRLENCEQFVEKGVWIEVKLPITRKET